MTRLRLLAVLRRPARPLPVAGPEPGAQAVPSHAGGTDPRAEPAPRPQGAPLIGPVDASPKFWRF